MLGGDRHEKPARKLIYFSHGVVFSSLTFVEPVKQMIVTVDGVS